MFSRALGWVTASWKSDLLQQKTWLWPTCKISEGFQVHTDSVSRQPWVSLDWRGKEGIWLVCIFILWSLSLRIQSPYPLVSPFSSSPVTRCVHILSWHCPKVSGTQQCLPFFRIKIIPLIFQKQEGYNLWLKPRCSDCENICCLDVSVSIESESEVVQSCPTLCDPMDSSRPGSSVHVIFLTRILVWVAISFSRGSSQARDRTWVSRIVGSLSHQGSPQLEKSFLAQIWRRRNSLFVSERPFASVFQWEMGPVEQAWAKPSLLNLFTDFFFFFKARKQSHPFGQNQSWGRNPTKLHTN